MSKLETLVVCAVWDIICGVVLWDWSYSWIAFSAQATFAAIPWILNREKS